jgi:hypothetical protein
MVTLIGVIFHFFIPFFCIELDRCFFSWFYFWDTVCMESTAFFLDTRLTVNHFFFVGDIFFFIHFLIFSFFSNVLMALRYSILI